MFEYSDSICGVIVQPDGSGRGVPCIAGGKTHLASSCPDSFEAPDDFQAAQHAAWAESVRYHRPEADTSWSAYLEAMN